MGQTLADQAEIADQQVEAAGFDIQFGKVSSPLSQKARALIYLTYASAADEAALDDIDIYVTSAMPCHVNDCPEGIALSRDERGQLRALAMSNLQSYEDGSKLKSWAPVLVELATPERVSWSEGVLNCRFEGEGSLEARPKSPAQVSEGSSTDQDVLVTTVYTGPSRLEDLTQNSDGAKQPTEQVVKVYGSYAVGQGYYCDTNTVQTDLYAKANARAECKKQGGTDGGTYISASGFSTPFGRNAKACYEAQAYTDCVFRDD